MVVSERASDIKVGAKSNMWIIYFGKSSGKIEEQPEVPTRYIKVCA